MIRESCTRALKSREKLGAFQTSNNCANLELEQIAAVKAQDTILQLLGVKA